MQTGNMIAVLGLCAGLTLGLSGCFGGKNVTVNITGSENEVHITAPGGYDTLAVAEGHCRSFKKKAIYNGRGEARGGVTVTNFKCMVR